MLTNDAERASEIPPVEEARVQLTKCTEKLDSASRCSKDGL